MSHSNTKKKRGQQYNNNARYNLSNIFGQFKKMKQQNMDNFSCPYPQNCSSLFSIWPRRTEEDKEEL